MKPTPLVEFWLKPALLIVINLSLIAVVHHAYWIMADRSFGGLIGLSLLASGIALNTVGCAALVRRTSGKAMCGTLTFLLTVWLVIAVNTSF